jgi:hypothetical protein
MEILKFTGQDGLYGRNTYRRLGSSLLWTDRTRDQDLRTWIKFYGHLYGRLESFTDTECSLVTWEHESLQSRLRRLPTNDSHWCL